jgi:hypothetical protein
MSAKIFTMLDSEAEAQGAFAEPLLAKQVRGFYFFNIAARRKPEAESQRKTFCKRPYAGVDYNLTLCQLIETDAGYQMGEGQKLMHATQRSKGYKLMHATL